MVNMIKRFLIAVLICLLPSVALGATYYVATTGNDSTGDGSSGNPWKTLGKALDNVPPGTTGNPNIIQIAPGSYSGNATSSGEDSNPAKWAGYNCYLTITTNYLTIRGASSSNKPVFNAAQVIETTEQDYCPGTMEGIFNVQGTEVTIQDVKVKRSRQHGIHVQGDDCTLTRIDAFENWQSGLRIRPCDNATIQYCNVYNNTIRYHVNRRNTITACGKSWRTTGPAIGLNGVTNSVIQYCHIYDNYNEGMDIGNSGLTLSSNITIRYNYIHGNRVVQLYLLKGSYYYVYSNLIHGTWAGAPRPIAGLAGSSANAGWILNDDSAYYGMGPGIEIDNEQDGSGADHYWIYSNWVANCTPCIKFASGDVQTNYVYLYNNLVFYGFTAAQITTLESEYATRGAIDTNAVYCGSNTGTGYQWINNIVYVHTASLAAYMTSIPSGHFVTVSSNIWYVNGGSASSSLESHMKDPDTDLFTDPKIYAVVNSLPLDPENLESSSGVHFSITAESSARDEAESITGYNLRFLATSFDTVPITVTTTTTAIGSAFDRGPWEFGSPPVYDKPCVSIDSPVETCWETGDLATLTFACTPTVDAALSVSTYLWTADGVAFPSRSTEEDPGTLAQCGLSWSAGNSYDVKVVMTDTAGQKAEATITIDVRAAESCGDPVPTTRIISENGTGVYAGDSGGIVDAFVKSDEPNKNTGSYSALRVKYVGSYEFDTVLSIPIPDVPGTITSVTLGLYQTSSPTAAVGIDIYDSSDVFTAHATWNCARDDNHDANCDTPWTGGAGSPENVIKVNATENIGIVDNVWVTWTDTGDLKDLVEAAQGSTVYIVLIQDTEDSTATIFTSSDGADGYRPYLSISYNIPADTNINGCYWSTADGQYAVGDTIRGYCDWNSPISFTFPAGFAPFVPMDIGAVTPLGTQGSHIKFWWGAENADALRTQPDLDYSAGDGTATKNETASYDGTVYKVGAYSLKAANGNDYAEFTISSYDIFPQTKGQLGFWLYTGTFVDSAVLWEAHADVDDFVRIRLDGVSGNIELQVMWSENGTTYNFSTANADMTENTWYFVQLLYDATANSRRFYINGVANDAADTQNIGFAFDTAPTSMKFGLASADAALVYVDNIMLADEDDRAVVDLWKFAYMSQCPSHLQLYTTTASGISQTRHYFSTDGTNPNAAITQGMTATDLNLVSGIANDIDLNGGTTTGSQDIPAAGFPSGINIDTTAPTISAMYLCNCETEEQITDSSPPSGTVLYNTADEDFCACLVFAESGNYFTLGPLSDFALPVDMAAVPWGDMDLVYYRGAGGSTWVLGKPLDAGDRDNGTEAVVTGTGDFKRDRGGDSILAKIVDLAGNELADYTLPHTWLVDANILRVIVPMTITLGSGGLWANQAAFQAAGGYSVPGDIFSILESAGAIDTDKPGTAAKKISWIFNGKDAPGITLDESYNIVKRGKLTSNVSLTATNTEIEAFVVPSGVTLTLNNATGVSARNLTINGTLAVPAPAAAINLAVPGTVSLSSGITLTAQNCAFSQTKAQIEVAGGTLSDTDCLFAVTQWGFKDEAQQDFRLRYDSPLKSAGTPPPLNDLLGKQITATVGAYGVYGISPAMLNAAGLL